MIAFLTTKKNKLSKMARSKEAIRRRALKRNRTEQEQRAIDGRDLDKDEGTKKTKKYKTNDAKKMDTKPFSGKQSAKTAFLITPGKAISELDDKQVNHHEQEKTKECKDMETTYKKDNEKNVQLKSNEQNSVKRKPVSRWKCPKCEKFNMAYKNKCKATTNCTGRRPINRWSDQANPLRLERNQLLRQQYQETGGEGMAESEIVRAKILLERDERKRQQKLSKQTLATVHQ